MVNHAGLVRRRRQTTAGAGDAYRRLLSSAGSLSLRDYDYHRRRRVLLRCRGWLLLLSSLRQRGRLSGGSGRRTCYALGFRQYRWTGPGKRNVRRVCLWTVGGAGYADTGFGLVLVHLGSACTVSVTGRGDAHGCRPVPQGTGRPLPAGRGRLTSLWGVPFHAGSYRLASRSARHSLSWLAMASRQSPHTSIMWS